MRAYNHKRKPKHTTKLRYAKIFGRMTATATHTKASMRSYYKGKQWKRRSYRAYSIFLELSFKKENNNV